MPTYTQANRPLAIKTPLGEDALLLTGIRGHEAISHLFSFQLDLLAELETQIRFDGIMGQNVTLELRVPGEDKRYFNGIVKSFTQGSRDEIFVHFRAEIVPKLWLLTRKYRSRIFQHLTVPDILHKVLSGLDVSYKLSGNYFPRDYCVQYRESDFDFVSRLMEEEGIYYFFKHSDGSHEMVVTDVPNRHPAVPGQSKVTYEEVLGGARNDMRVTAWEKTQELRSGSYALWDHCFELPGKNLEAKERTIDSVTVGKVSHKLNVGGNDELEIYDYPGGYAQRFDGVDSSGGARPQDLKDIFKDSDRTVRIRMEQEEVGSLRVEGAGNCAHFVAGHTFTLERHFDANGDYLLTQIEHAAVLKGSYRSGKSASDFHYENHFTCLPVSLPYRPQRVTRKPVISGIQTATVVGPAGQEIFCDKYGRVKVQFHWDREGKKNSESSCWLRVAQVWAGKGWGAFFWPRIGHEVVVAFEEGDPDQPTIVGSVYNAQNMPPFSLPKFRTFGGFKSCSEQGSPSKNFNGVLFVDSAGHEHLAIHSERHMVIYAEYDRTYRVGRHQAERVPGARAVTVGGLPSGGGSGGGPNKNLWQTPEPLSIGGLNTVVVYGGNFQIAFPVNMQLAYGTNLQICVNPASFGLAFPDTADATLSSATTQLLGSGLGGNMQIALGTNANIIMGQSINVTIGPRPINVGEQDKAFTNPAALKLGNIINLVIALFLLAYTIPDDDFRSVLLMSFQLGIQFILYKMMDFHMLYTGSDGQLSKTYNEVFGSTEVKPSDPPGAFESPGAVESLLVAAIVPVLVDSVGESVLDTSGGGSN